MAAAIPLMQTGRGPKYKRRDRKNSEIRIARTSKGIFQIKISFFMV
jgi:hypothetical protein